MAVSSASWRCGTSRLSTTTRSRSASESPDVPFVATSKRCACCCSMPVNSKIRSGGEYAVLLQLLDEALDLPVEARSGWVEQLSGSHAELRPTLRRMLLATSAPETGEVIDLKSHIAAVVRNAASQPKTHELQAGEHIGPYELVREIG